MTYSAFALDPVTHDLEMPVRILRGSEAIAQRVRVRFRWWLYEWFLDRRTGVPYLESILVKSPDPVLISGIFRKVLLTTPGVSRVDTFSTSLDANTRTLSVDFVAVLDDGSNLAVSNSAFIIV